MEFDHAFCVSAPTDAVWTTITDIERVAPCIPKTRVTGRAGRNSYDVEIMAAVGPFEITSQANITLVERDDGARREVLRIVANDADGDKLAEAKVTIVLMEEGSATHGAVHSHVEVDAIATLVSEQTLDAVAGDTLRTFAANLEALVQRRRARP